MSSILIKGMEMPKSCGQCQIKLGIDCELWRHVRSVSLDRHKDCPLVSVPPHFGDLIDRAMLVDSFEPSDFWNSSAEDNCFAAIRITNSMPAIIPAEEKS